MKTKTPTEDHIAILTDRVQEVLAQAQHRKSFVPQSDDRPCEHDARAFVLALLAAGVVIREPRP